MNVALDPISLIEARRTAAGVSIEQLVAAAGISRRHYDRLRKADDAPGRAVIARLKAALGRLTGRPSEIAVPEIRLVLYAYFAVLGIVCQRLGVSTDSVHAQDPRRKATADPAWMAATGPRRMAIYLVNCALGIPQNDIARAIGLTPAAISLSCKAVERDREDGETDRLLDELTRTITGEV